MNLLEWPDISGRRGGGVWLIGRGGKREMGVEKGLGKEREEG